MTELRTVIEGVEEEEEEEEQRNMFLPPPPNRAQRQRLKSGSPKKDIRQRITVASLERLAREGVWMPGKGRRWAVHLRSSSSSSAPLLRSLEWWLFFPLLLFPFLESNYLPSGRTYSLFFFRRDLCHAERKKPKNDLNWKE